MTFAERAQNPGNCFDFQRFIFATAVIFSHSFALLHGMTGPEKLEPIVWLTGGGLSFGAVALSGFFILSGYLVLQSWQNSKGVIDYLRRRILRIYPGFVAACLVSVIVIGLLASADRRIFLRHLHLPSLLGHSLILSEPKLTGVFHNVPFPDVFNGSLWTIKWEFCCYLLIPVLAWVGLLRRRVGITFLFAFSAIIYGAFCYGQLISVERSFRIFGGPAYGWLRCGGYFLAGMTFYLWRDRLPYRASWFVAAIFGLLAFYRWIDLALMVLGPYLLFYAGYASNSLLQQWSRFGDFSYGLYLYAWPIQQLTVQTLGRSHLTSYSLFAVSFCFIALFAVFSWFVIERPFLRLKYGSRSKAHESGPTLDRPLVKTAEADHSGTRMGPLSSIDKAVRPPI